MGQWQEDQQLFAFGQVIGEAGLGATDLVEQVGVGQLAALGPAGGARGVDQRGRIGRPDAGQALLDRGIVHLAAGLRQLLQSCGPAAVDAVHRLQCGQRRTLLLDAPGVLVGLGERGDRAGVGEDELHLLGGTGLIDRHRHRAHRQDGEVEDRPLVARRRQDRHPVAGRDSGSDETFCRRTDLLGGLGAGHVDPAAVDQSLEDHVVGVVALVRVDGADDVVVLADGE